VGEGFAEALCETECLEVSEQEISHYIHHTYICTLVGMYKFQSDELKKPGANPTTLKFTTTTPAQY
jgi:hypothetical protein